MTQTRLLLIGCTVGLGGCAVAPPLPVTSSGQTADARVIARLEVQAPVALPQLEQAWLGRLPDAALRAEIAEQLALAYDWLEWREVQVQVASALGAANELHVEVRAEPPLRQAGPPLADEVPVLQMSTRLEPLAPPPARSGSDRRVESVLDAGLQAWLLSAHRVLVDAQARRLYLKRDNQEVVSYGIAVGTGRTPTPQGEYKVEAIRHKPAWYPPASIRREYAAKGKELPLVVPPGKGNPLGEYFVRLQNGIGIHGTNQPRSIGRAVSHGCIRMHDEDVKQLASELKTGDGIWVVHQRASAPALKEAVNEVLWGMRAHPGVQSTAR